MRALPAPTAAVSTSFAVPATSSIVPPFRKCPRRFGASRSRRWSPGESSHRLRGSAMRVGERRSPTPEAERAGFEPATHLSARTRFPVALLRPLGHLSEGRHRNPIRRPHSPKTRTALIIPTKKRIETKTNQPRLRPGNSGRERGMTIAEMSAKSTNARPESPRPSLCRRRERRRARGETNSYALLEQSSSLRRRAARTPNTSAAASSAIGARRSPRRGSMRARAGGTRRRRARSARGRPGWCGAAAVACGVDERQRDGGERSLAHGARARLRLLRERALRLVELVLQAKPLVRRRAAGGELALELAIVACSATICRRRTFACRCQILDAHALSLHVAEPAEPEHRVLDAASPARAARATPCLCLPGVFMSTERDVAAVATRDLHRAGRRVGEAVVARRAHAATPRTC